MAIQAQLYSENLIGFPVGGGSQDWMDNACGFNEFCFNLQQQQKIQQQQQYMQHQQQQLQSQRLQQQQQRNQDLLCFDNSFLLHRNNDNNKQHQQMAFSQGLSVQIEKQRQEIDQFISLENEKLRLAIQEQRKQQLVSILKKYESKTQILLRQKDEEIAKAVNRTMELEEFLRRMELENQTWQKMAKENEAMVASLNNTIEQLRESSCFSANGAEDAESCCDMIETREDEAGNNQGEEDEGKKMMNCKSCSSGNSCVVFLPCRHLCSCKACEAFLETCPVCKMVKKASIEVLI